ncbi:hypothetical protein CMV16_08120 [Peribacillus simplex]|nr:hypothetical protein CMV16_08120 [Peribacillus simplex]
MHNYGLSIDICLITPDGKKAVWDTKADFNKGRKSDWMEVVEEARNLASHEVEIGKVSMMHRILK